jgi:hypothetical protein
MTFDYIKTERQKEFFTKQSQANLLVISQLKDLSSKVDNATVNINRKISEST